MAAGILWILHTVIILLFSTEMTPAEAELRLKGIVEESLKEVRELLVGIDNSKPQFSPVFGICTVALLTIVDKAIVVLTSLMSIDSVSTFLHLASEEYSSIDNVDDYYALLSLVSVLSRSLIFSMELSFTVF